MEIIRSKLVHMRLLRKFDIVFELFQDSNRSIEFLFTRGFWPAPLWDEPRFSSGLFFGIEFNRHLTLKNLFIDKEIDRFFTILCREFEEFEKFYPLPRLANGGQFLRI